MATVWAVGIMMAAWSSDVPAYALVVGTNQGGAGQRDLAYAHEDARRVADVLAELGGYQEDRITVVLDPDRAGLLQALEALASKIEVHARADEQAQALFYYSGHARSDVLVLGNETLSLQTLRTQLDAMPAHLKLVVLDACQSGAFSNVKGAAAGADFSFNSASQLRTRGLAVLASSTGSELSQESARLRGSFFTHHWVVGLRGAGDVDGDGRVSLNEAYRYAYHHTVVDTAQTRVGAQHVTLETNLAGEGEVVLTTPGQATAHLVLDPALDGSVVIYHAEVGTVVAELTKAPGQPMRLALPEGSYRAALRADNMVHACEVTLIAATQVHLQRQSCERVMRDITVSKEGGVQLSPWSVDVVLGLMVSPESNGDFYWRAAERGFLPQEGGSLELSSLEVRGWRQLLPFFTLGVEVASLGKKTFFTTLGTDGPTLDAYSFGVGAVTKLHHTLPGEWLAPYTYGVVGIGLTFVERQRDDVTPSDIRTGATASYYLRGGGGLHFFPASRLSFFSEARYTYAPVLQDNGGRRGSVGGASLHLGLAYRF